MRNPLLFASVCIAMCTSARASFTEEISLREGTVYTQDFDSIARSGPSGKVRRRWLSAEARLPEGWLATAGWFDHDRRVTQDDGRRLAESVYSYGSRGSVDRGLGSLQGWRRWGGGPLFGVVFQNDSEAPISQLRVEFTGEEWRLGAPGRMDRLDFQFSTDAQSLRTGHWIDLDMLDFVTPNTDGVGRQDGNAAENRELLAAQLDLLIQPGQKLWLRWNDWDAVGLDSGLAIDDFCLTVVPEPRTWAAAALLCVVGLSRGWRNTRR